MTLAEELAAKYYDPDMETCDVNAIVNAALERAAQECEFVAGKLNPLRIGDHSDETAVGLAKRIRALMDEQRSEVQP